MKRYCLVIFLWFYLSPAKSQPYLVTDIFAYSEPLSINDAIYEEEGSFRGGEKALTHNWAEIGITYKGFGLGYLQRYDYDLEFSQDTAEFYYLINNKKPLPEGRQYDLYLSALHYRTRGLRLSYTLDLNKKTTLNVGLSYLKGISLTDGTAHGSGTILAENDYEFQFDVDYYYSEDAIFDRVADSPQGQGYSFDFHLDWGISDDLNLNLRVRDFIGRIYWENAPYTTAQASSDVKEYDEDGYLIYKPILSGYELNGDYTQKLRPQIKALLDYDLNSNLEVLGQMYHFYRADFFQIGLRYSFNSMHNISTLYMFDTNALSFGYHMKYFNIMLTSDSFNIDNAHTFAFSLNVLAPI